MHMFRIVTGFVMMDKSVIQEWRLLFLSTPFLPEALLAYGYCHRLCLCVCVYLCLCQLLLVRTITHHAFQLESPDLYEKMQNILFTIVLGADWAWPSMSNLTSFYNSVYLYRFCVFEIFVRRAKTEFVKLFHIAHGAAHILIPLYAHRQGRATDRETVYEHIFVRPSESCQPSTRRLAVDFTSCCRFSPNHTHLTYRYFI